MSNRIGHLCHYSSSGKLNHQKRLRSKTKLRLSTFQSFNTNLWTFRPDKQKLFFQKWAGFFLIKTRLHSSEIATHKKILMETNKIIAQHISTTNVTQTMFCYILPSFQLIAKTAHFQELSSNGRKTPHTLILQIHFSFHSGNPRNVCIMLNN